MLGIFVLSGIKSRFFFTFGKVMNCVSFNQCIVTALHSKKKLLNLFWKIELLYLVAVPTAYGAPSRIRTAISILTKTCIHHRVPHFVPFFYITINVGYLTYYTSDSTELLYLVPSWRRLKATHSVHVPVVRLYFQQDEFKQGVNSVRNIENIGDRIYGSSRRKSRSSAPLFISVF